MLFHSCISQILPQKSRIFGIFATKMENKTHTRLPKISICLVFFFLSFFLTSCQSGKRTTSASQKINDPDFIEMEKGSCYGKCKVYKISVNSKGEATYTGKSNVPKTGSYKKMLSREENKELWKLVERTDLFSFKGEYEYVPDVPSTTFRYSKDDTTKKIEYWTRPPETLSILEEKLKQIAESDGWEKQ